MHAFGRSPFTTPAKPVHDLALQATEIDGWLAGVNFIFASVLAAVEAKPAAPVLAALAASTAPPRHREAGKPNLEPSFVSATALFQNEMTIVTFADFGQDA